MCYPQPTPSATGVVGAINTSPRAVGIETIPKPNLKIIGPSPRIDTDDDTQTGVK